MAYNINGLNVHKKRKNVKNPCDILMILCVGVRDADIPQGTIGEFFIEIDVGLNIEKHVAVCVV